MGALVITRKKTEEIHIKTKAGDVIIIFVSRVRGKEVRIGVNCDRKKFSILRGELSDVEGNK